MSQNEFIDDANSSIIYAPSNVWDLNTNFASFGPRNGTIHSSAQENATATFRFKGTSIKVYGLLYPTGCNVSATLDGSSLGTYNLAVETSSLANVQAIFSKDGLDASKQHEIVLTKMANNPGWTSTVSGDPNSHLNLDGFEVGGSDGSNGGQTTPNGSTPPSTSSSSSSNPPTGAIAGGVVGGVLLLVALGLAFWFIRRRRRAKQREAELVLPSGEKIEPSKPDPEQMVIPNKLDGERRSPRGRDLDGLRKAGFDAGSPASIENHARTSLFELPGHRVVHLTSDVDVGASTAVDTASDRSRGRAPFIIPTGERRIDGAHRSGIGSAGDPSVPASVTTGTLMSQSVAPESINTFPLDHSSQVESLSGGGRADSSVLPLSSTLGPTPSSAQNDLSRKDGPRRQGTQQGPHQSDTKSPVPSGTGSIGATDASPTNFTVMTSGSSDRVTSTARSDTTNTSALLQELAGLREQVRQLAQLHGRNGPYDQPHPDDPPPEYEGRDSDEETDLQSPLRQGVAPRPNPASNS